MGPSTVVLLPGAAAHVEQKNGAVVRQLVGYDRFTARAAYGNASASTASPACTSTSFSSPWRSS
jgi:hypothetical protein